MIKLVRIEELNNPETGNLTKYLVVDNEVFDWGLDDHAARKAILACQGQPETIPIFLGDLQQNFLACFSEFIGKEFSLLEVNEAIEKGFLEI